MTLNVQLPIEVLNKSGREIDLSGMSVQLRACGRCVPMLAEGGGVGGGCMAT